MSKSLSPIAPGKSLPAFDKTILLLGGTAEASELAERLARDGRFRLIYSLAGRTREPALPNCEVRVGGFGGTEGLELFLLKNDVALVVDATHPFATQISENAFAAAKYSGAARIALVRPVWVPELQDLWRTVSSMEEAVRTLPSGARAFLALGSQHVAGFAQRTDVDFTLRMIDRPETGLLENCRVITGKPGTSAEEEARLFSELEITHLVCRNSGGSAGYAKIAAARQLGLPVVLIERPPAPEQPHLSSVDQVFAFIDLACRSARRV